MSSEFLLLDTNGWTWIAIIALLVIGGYFFHDKLMRKGIYEEGRMSGGMMGRAGSALSELQTLVAPAQRNVIEERQERKRAEHDDAGDDPAPTKYLFKVKQHVRIAIRLLPVYHSSAMKIWFALFLLLSSVSFAQSHSSAAQSDETQQLLQSLADAPGPSGFEEPVRKIMVEHMKPLAEKLSYDGLGSVIAVQGSSGPRIMVDAHMDELGGVIRRVTNDGYLTMQMLGGWLDQALVDQRWTIIGSKGPVRAITGIRDVHIVPQEERGKVYPREWIFLDVGAKNAAEVAAMGLEPGDPVAPDAPFAVMNGTQNYLGKGWDDRVGCAVVIEAMKRLAHLPHPNQIFWVATVQEELGVRGAHTSSDIVKPEIGIAIEGGVTRDAPRVGPEEAQEVLGGGPAIFLYDSSELPNRKLVSLFKQTAKEKSIPLQTDLIQGYGDDSAEIQKSNGGAPTANLVVPVRYTHSHNGIMNRGDFDKMVDLLVAVLQKLDAKAVANLRDFIPE